MIEMHKLARPKLTGVKVQISSGVPRMTEHGRMTAKSIPNQMVNDILGGLMQFHGEIVIGKPEAVDCYEKTLEFLKDPYMLHLFVFWVYDLRTTNLYLLKDRLEMAQSFVNTCGPNVQYVDHELIETQKALIKYKQKVLDKGFSGIILREPYGTFGTYDEEITPETALS